MNPDSRCPVGGMCSYGCPPAECYRERTAFRDTPFAGWTSPVSDPTPIAEDYRRADLLMEGFLSAHPDPAGRPTGELRELFARGIAVARTGGDVLEFLRREGWR